MTINVLEIRNYLFKPETAGHFIDYFEAHFIHSQEAVGMHVLGQFRLIGEPDRFVWIRGFNDMQSRLESLQNFYNGTFWKKYKPFTDEIMLEWHNVHLLRPLGSLADLTCGADAVSMAAALAAGTISPYTGMVGVDFYHALPGQRDALIERFQSQVVPMYHDQAVQLRGCFVAEMSENTFPRLPVIQNADELMVITAHESEVTCREKHDTVVQRIHEKIGTLLSAPTESLLLSPTLRSPLR